MGISYRKGFRLGPVRINLSGSGIGVSIGAGPFRTGVSARGQRYDSINLPGVALIYFVPVAGN